MIEAAPADTARAMHAAEMRGQDMQDAIKSRITDEDMHESGRYFMDCFRDVASCSHGDTGNYNNPYDGRMISELWNAHRAGKLITEAECQRRIDAAVLAERDVLMEALGIAQYGLSWASAYFRDNNPTYCDEPCPPVTRGLDATRAAIRARGQK